MANLTKEQIEKERVLFEQKLLTKNNNDYEELNRNSNGIYKNIYTQIKFLGWLMARGD